MTRVHAAAFLSLALVSQAASAQDGLLNRAGRALDNTGKSIRYRVESEIARGKVDVQERDVLHRVVRRIEWDKQLVGSALQIEAQPGGVIVLRGSVRTEDAKRRTLDLVDNTIGVTKVVSELALVKDVKVIESAPTQAVVTPLETRVVAPPVPVPVPVPAPAPVGPKIIVKP